MDVWLRPVKCNKCDIIETIKMTCGKNNLASYTCTACRNVNPKNEKNIEKYYKGFYKQIELPMHSCKACKNVNYKV